MNTKAQLVKRVRGFGAEAEFAANVVLNWHRAPVRKLRKLVALLESGHRVGVRQFSLDVLVDGQPVRWHDASGPA